MNAALVLILLVVIAAVLFLAFESGVLFAPSPLKEVGEKSLVGVEENSALCKFGVDKNCVRPVEPVGCDLISCPQGFVCEENSLGKGVCVLDSACFSYVSYPLFEIPEFDVQNKIYLTDKLDKVRDIVAEENLPHILAAGIFEGTVTSTVLQKIDIKPTSEFSFGKQPMDNDDPRINILMNTDVANYPTYASVIDIEPPTQFSHNDSIGEQISLFGRDYVVGAGTTEDKLTLFGNGERVFFDTQGQTSYVYFNGLAYTIEFIAGSDTSATLGVTDSFGNSEIYEIAESTAHRFINVWIGLINADETNFSLTADIVVGTRVLIFEDGQPTKFACDAGECAIDGTNARLRHDQFGTSRIEVYVAAPNLDMDAITEGRKFRDTVWGSFEIDFDKLNMQLSAHDYDNILFALDENQMRLVVINPFEGGTDFFVTPFVYKTPAGELVLGDDFGGGERIKAVEMEPVYWQDFLITANNEEGGRFLQVIGIHNASGFSDDYVRFSDIITDELYEVTITSEGIGTFIIDGQSYTVYYYGAADSPVEERYVRVNYPMSTGNNLVVYPTILTYRGAAIAYAETKVIELTNYDGQGSQVSGLMLPIGENEYETLPIQINADGTYYVDGQFVGPNSLDLEVEEVVYKFSNPDPFGLMIRPLQSGQGGTTPSLIIFEEQDDANTHEAIVVETEGDGQIGIYDTERTWSDDLLFDEIQSSTNPDLFYSLDRWGTLIITDRSNFDSANTFMSYPDKQVYAEVYINEICQDLGQCVIPPGGMVSWWTGDEDASDIIGNNDGSLENGAAIVQNGKVQGAFSFDGVDDYVSVQDSDSLDVDSITIDAWVKPEEQGEEVFIVGKYGSYVLGLDEENTIACVFYFDNQSIEIGPNFPILELDQWHHLACVYDFTTGEASAYVNGENVYNEQLTRGIALRTSSSDLSIGGMITDSGNILGNFNGLIDEVEIFNRALTEQEIQQIYLAESAGKCRGGTLFCGNFIVEPQLGEECDDGNYNPDDQCYQCLLTYCGDSVIQEPNGVGLGGISNDGNEQCDCGDDDICTPDELGGASCFQYGGTGTLGCYTIDENPPLACTFDFSSCDFPFCGDGICGAGENACNCDIDCPGICEPCPPLCWYDKSTGLCIC